MSYSRWSNSIWYTFWASGASDTKEDQRFEICDFARTLSFTYKELKENIDSCLDTVIKLGEEKISFKLLSDAKTMTYTNHTAEPIYYTEDQIKELKSYMVQFIKDMEEEYD